MMHSVRIRALATAVCAGLFASLLFAADAGKFAVKKKTTLGGEGGWDYLTWDAAGQRLFIARDRMGVKPVYYSWHDRTLVFASEIKALFEHPDITARPNLPAIAEYMNAMYTTGEHTWFDGIERLLPGHYMLADENGLQVHQWWDVPNAEEPPDGRGTVFVNIEDKAELVALDTKKLAVKNRWKMGKCEEPTGLALDEKNRRLFAGCSNKEMAIMDADSGKVIAELPIGDYVDATAFDAKLGLAFSSNGDGTLTIVREENPNKFSVAQTATTQRGARTMTLDAASHTIYTVTADFGPPQANGRPSVLPGTFVVMEIGK